MLAGLAFLVSELANLLREHLSLRSGFRHGWLPVWWVAAGPDIRDCR